MICLKYHLLSTLYQTPSSVTKLQPKQPNHHCYFHHQLFVAHHLPNHKSPTNINLLGFCDLKIPWRKRVREGVFVILYYPLPWNHERNRDKNIATHCCLWSHHRRSHLRSHPPHSASSLGSLCPVAVSSQFWRHHQRC